MIYVYIYTHTYIYICTSVCTCLFIYIICRYTFMPNYCGDLRGGGGGCCRRDPGSHGEASSGASKCGPSGAGMVLYVKTRHPYVDTCMYRERERYVYLYVHIYMYMYLYVYMYVHMHVCLDTDVLCFLGCGPQKGSTEPTKRVHPGSRCVCVISYIPIPPFLIDDYMVGDASSMSSGSKHSI